MFKFIKRRWRGVVSYSKLYNDVLMYYIRYTIGEDFKNSSFYAVFSDHEKQIAQEYSSLVEPYLATIANADSRDEQMLILRHVTLEAAKLKSLPNAFLSDSFSETERKIIAEKVFNEKNEKYLAQSLYYNYIVHHIFCGALRSLAAKYYADAQNNDWYSTFCETHPELIQLGFKKVIADANNEVFVLEPMHRMLHQQFENFEASVRSGTKHLVDEEQRRKSREEIDKHFSVPDKKEIQKISQATPEQLQALGKLLDERHKLLQNSQLYVAHGIDLVGIDEESEEVVEKPNSTVYPTNPELVIPVDIGAMLIALVDVIETKQGAMNAIRSGMEIAYKTAVDTQIPEKLLEIWENNSNDGPLAYVTTAAAKLIFHDMIVADPEEEKAFAQSTIDLTEYRATLDAYRKDLMIKLAVAINEDFWNMIELTKQVFIPEIQEEST